MKSHQVGSGQQFRLQWQNPPWILLALLVFAVLSTTVSLSHFYALQFYEMIVPVTGWTGLSIYMVTLIAVAIALFSLQRRAIYNVSGALVVVAAFGLFDTYDHTLGSRAGEDDFDNPYLIYSPWRPLITVVLPLFWAAMLMSSPMKRWIKGGGQSVSDE